jgi:hypothetical protein
MEVFNVDLTHAGTGSPPSIQRSNSQEGTIKRTKRAQPAESKRHISQCMCSHVMIVNNDSLPNFCFHAKKHNDRYTLVLCRSSESRKEMMPPITATARVLEESFELTKRKKSRSLAMPVTQSSRRGKEKKVSFLQDRDLERPSYINNTDEGVGVRHHSRVPLQLSPSCRKSKKCRTMNPGFAGLHLLPLAAVQNQGVVIVVVAIMLVDHTSAVSRKDQ